MVALRAVPLYEGGMTAKPRRATYRHGNLKSAALKAATRLVAAAGREQLSLREVSRKLGVYFVMFCLGDTVGVSH